MEHFWHAFASRGFDGDIWAFMFAFILLGFIGEKTIDTVLCKFHDRSISAASLKNIEIKDCKPRNGG